LLTWQQIHFVAAVKDRTDSDRNGSVRESILNGYYKKPKQFLEATLLAKLLFFSIYSVFAYQLFYSTIPGNTYMHRWLLAVAFIFSASLAYILLCEFLPRLIYDYKASRSSLKPLFLSISIVFVLFYPLAKIFFQFSKFILKIAGRKPSRAQLNDNWGGAIFDYWIREQSHKEEDPEMEIERKFIQNVIDFSSTRVKDSMVPRTEIVSVNIATATASELKEKFSKSGHSRIIVYEEDIDHVCGYIHSLEMFDNPNNWKEHIKEVPFVPETMAAHDLMTELMQKRKNLAVVVDEFGGTVGIITLEDLVEEIFGEIEDEHDKNSIIERKINDKEYIFAGRMEIDYINEKYHLNLPVSEDYLTLAGYLLFVNQRFPTLNQVLTIGNISYTILKISPTKIELVKVVVDS
jgi:CBS domain containing-hemolysin-like protein